MTQLCELHRFSRRLRDVIRSNSALAGEAPLDGGEFNRLALELFALQYGSVAAYRRFADRRGADPSRVSNWDEIPAIPTSAFKEFDLSAWPPALRTHVFFSSGTTRQRPSRHFHGRESLQVYEASLSAGFQRHLLPDLAAAGEMKLAALTPPLEAAPNSSLVHMFDAVGRLFRFNAVDFVGRVEGQGAWTLDFAQAVEVLESSIRARVPLLLLGTAFSFVHLADYLAAEAWSFVLPGGSRVLETGGYKGRSRVLSKPELHQAIRSRLGLPDTQLVSEYGMSELSSQAYDQVAGTGLNQGPARVFRFPPWARFRIVSPETGDEVQEGETGLVQILDLANAYSVAAVLTEDLATRVGAGFQLLGRSPQAEPRGCSLTAQS